jgi:outer membrane protein OmpA-like peptidoglycan-associated protein
MKRIHATLMLLPLAWGASSACSAERMPPKALVDARTHFVRARDGVATQLDPTDVHEAEVALQRAERAWLDAPDDPSTVDLALVADRKALIAQAGAETLEADRDARQAATRLEEVRAGKLRTAEKQLGQTQQALGRTEMQLQQEQASAAAQQQKLQELEAKLRDARDTIARIASVKDDARGMVITLQGEVLFKTGKYDLKPAAMAKLDLIAEALKGKEQPIAVFGHTDNVGTVDNNMALSMSRAQTVRDYLVGKGIPPDLVTAQGKGPAEAVADNSSVEGRAQNRRVEIVVQPRR